MAPVQVPGLATFFLRFLLLPVLARRDWTRWEDDVYVAVDPWGLAFFQSPASMDLYATVRS